MAYLLTCDAFPYALGSASLTTLPTDAGGEIDANLTLAAGVLDWEHSSLSWDERIEPIDGTLRVGGLTFRLFDPVVSAGTAAGHNLITWLATRAASRLTSTTLAGSMAAGATSFAVADGSAFPSGAQVVYIEGEAIRCSGRASNTFTVAASGRGAYMSRAVAHAVDAEGSIYPEVYMDPPFVARRRVILWHVDESTNVATALWRGVTQRAPRLAGSSPAVYEWQASHAWDVEQTLTIVDPNTTFKLRGYNAKALVLTFSCSPASLTGGYVATPSLIDPTTHVFDDAQAACGFVAEDSVLGFRKYLADHGGGITLRRNELTASGATLQWSVEVSGAGDCGVTLQAGIGPEVNDVGRGSDPRQMFVQVPLPSALVLGAPGISYRIPIDRYAGLPTTYTFQDFAEPIGHTYLDPLFVGNYDDKYDVVIRPDPSASPAVTADDGNLACHGPTLQGFLSYRPLSPEPPRFPGVPSGYAFALRGMDSASQGVCVDRALPMRFALRVRCNSWVYGLQRVLADTTYAQCGSDPRAYDWSTSASVAAVLDATTTMREWFFDGRQTVGETLKQLTALSGCAVGVRGSKLSLVALRRPTASESATATIARTDLVAGMMASWSVLPDGICNQATVKSGDTTLNIREARSVGRYGPARKIELDLTGLPPEVTLLDNYRQFANLILARVLYLWNNPVAVVKVPLNLSWMTKAYHGDFVAISEDMLPDGAGGRGLGNATALAALGVSAQYGQVIGRYPDLSNGVVWLELLLLPTAYGYSPAVRVTAAPTTSTLTVGTGYLLGGDYAAPSTGSTNGGAGTFKVNDKVRLVQRDTTSNTTVTGLTVSAVSGTTITVTPALSGAQQTAVNAAGTTWDLEYDGYGNGTGFTNAAQKYYAWVGTSTGNVIGTSTDAAQEWAP